MHNIIISYTYNESAIAEHLANALGTKGFNIVKDSSLIISGENVNTEINKILPNASAIILLLSKHSGKRESPLEQNLQNVLTGNPKVIPVLLDSKAKENWIWPLVSDRRTILVNELNTDQLISYIEAELFSATSNSEETESPLFVKGENLSLKKGGSFSLLGKEPTLERLLVGVGWDMAHLPKEASEKSSFFDLDVVAFLLIKGGNVRDERDFIFYNQPASPCGAIVLVGDALAGDSDSDDETLRIDLKRIPTLIHSIVICVTIYDAEVRKQNFGDLDFAYIRLLNLENNREIVRFDLTKNYSMETIIILGELTRVENGWTFNAGGEGFVGGLEALAKFYGVKVD